MKKLILSLLVAMTTLTASARTVWTGSKAVGWDDSFMLTTEQLGSTKAGDYFVFTFEVTDASNWPQFRIEDLSYNVLGSSALTAGMTRSGERDAP